MDADQYWPSVVLASGEELRSPAGFGADDFRDGDIVEYMHEEGNPQWILTSPRTGASTYGWIQNGPVRLVGFLLFFTPLSVFFVGVLVVMIRRWPLFVAVAEVRNRRSLINTGSFKVMTPAGVRATLAEVRASVEPRDRTEEPPSFPPDR